MGFAQSEFLDVIKWYFHSFVLFQGFESCENTSISFAFTTKKESGLLLYQGPSPNTIVENVTDFFALEIRQGKLTFFLSFGSEVWRGELDKNVHDEQEHSVNVRWSNETILMTIDGGACADFRQCNLQVRSRTIKSLFNSTHNLLTFRPADHRDRRSISILTVLCKLVDSTLVMIEYRI